MGEQQMVGGAGEGGSFSPDVTPRGANCLMYYTHTPHCFYVHRVLPPIRPPSLSLRLYTPQNLENPPSDLPLTFTHICPKPWVPGIRGSPSCRPLPPSPRPAIQSAPSSEDSVA